MKENKISKNTLMSIICVVVLIVAILIGPLVNYFLVKNNNEVNENTTDNSNQTSDVEDNNIYLNNELDISIFEQFIRYYLNEKSDNLLENDMERLTFTKIVLDVENKLSFTDEQIEETQSEYYVEYNIFKQKYEELFGGNYNSNIIDLDNGQYFNRCQNHRSISDGDYVCWLPLGVNPIYLELLINNRDETNEKVIITGTYETNEESREIDDYNGTFIIESNILNNQEYLNRISIIPNN